MSIFLLLIYINQPDQNQKTLIDNIFVNSIEYSSYSGNINIMLSDHLFQFTILEEFFRNFQPKRCNLKERDYKYFNEREFTEAINNLDINTILNIEENNPNKSVESLYHHVTYLLDEFAPYKNLSHREIQFKTRPWITKDMLHLMWGRDKLFSRYFKAKNIDTKHSLFNEYKPLRNELITKKRSGKIQYYRNYFDNNN